MIRRLAGVIILVLLTGCAPQGAGGSGQELTVLAAASLSEVFTELGEGYQRRTGTPVRVVFGSSASLARQITQGAPSDVFAAANPQTMATVVRAGAADGTPSVFARNHLVIAVPAANPGNVRSLADLTREELTVALCAPAVPCGAAARTALRDAGVAVSADTYEKDVKAVMAKLRLGEVDAALVYHTDVRAAGGEVTGIDFPEAKQAVNDYQITVLANPVRPEAARGFVDFVRSGTGRQALADAGFEAP